MTQIYYAGDCVVMRHMRKLKHGTITNVFEGSSRTSTGYRVVFDNGDYCPSASSFQMEPENPLEMLARCCR